MRFAAGVGEEGGIIGGNVWEADALGGVGGRANGVRSGEGVRLGVGAAGVAGETVRSLFGAGVGFLEAGTAGVAFPEAGGGAPVTRRNARPTPLSESTAATASTGRPESAGCCQLRQTGVS